MDNTEFYRYMDALDTSLAMPIRSVTDISTNLLVSKFARHHLDGADAEQSEADMPTRTKQKKKKKTGKSKNRFGYFHTDVMSAEHGPLRSKKQEKRKKSLHASRIELTDFAQGTPLGDAFHNVVQQVVAELGWNEADDYSLTKMILLLVGKGKSQENIASELSNELLGLAPGDTAASNFMKWLFQQMDLLTGISAQDVEINTLETVAVCYPKETKVWDDLARTNLKKTMVRKMVRKVENMRRVAMTELLDAVQQILLISKQFALDLRGYLQRLKKDHDSFKEAACSRLYSLSQSRELFTVKDTIWHCYYQYRNTMYKESLSIARTLEQIDKWQMCHPCWRTMAVEIVEEIVVHGLRGCTREAANDPNEEKVVRIGQDTARFLLVSREFARKTLHGIDEEIDEMWKRADTINENAEAIHCDGGYESPYERDCDYSYERRKLKKLIKLRKRIEKISDAVAGTFMRSEQIEQRRTARRALAEEKAGDSDGCMEEGWLVSEFSDSN